MNNANNLKHKRLQRQNSINLTVMQPTNNVFPPTRMHSISEDRLSQHSYQQRTQQSEGLKMRIQIQPQPQPQLLQSAQQTQAINQLLQQQQQQQQQQTQFLQQHTRQKQQQQSQQQQQQNIIPYVTLQVQQAGKATTNQQAPAQILQYQISNPNDTSNKPITQLLREHLSNSNRNLIPTRQTSQTLQHQSSSNSNESFTSSSTDISQIAANNLSPYMQPSLPQQQQQQQYAPQISNTIHLQPNIVLEQKQQQHQQLIPQLKPLLPNIQQQQLQQQQQQQQQQQPAFTQFRTTLLPNMLKQQQPQQQQHTNQTQPQLKAIMEEPAVTLLPEICDIMRSFGDSDRPRGDSVRLVEQILKQQLRDMFHEASMVAMRRKGSACPSQADFEFLMRNKPIKIARMRKHLKDMRILKKFLSIRTGRPQDFAEELERHESDEELSMDVPELFDEERTRRLFRADRISQTLNGQQYIDFNEARKTSFYCRHGEKIKNKFRSFLKLPTDLRIPVSIMNILAYFAHETIAVIVDYAILTRLNTSNRNTEPFSRVTSAGASAAMLHICPEVTQGRGMEVHKAITVQEIQEGMRRFQQMTNKGIGYGRRCTNGLRQAFLAL